MRKPKAIGRVAALALIGAACLAANGQPAENAPAPARPTRIAVLDLTRVFTQSTRCQKMREDLRRHQGELAKEENDRREAVNRMAGEIESYAMGTPQRTKLERERKAAMQDLQTWLNESVNEMDRKSVALMTLIYNEACAETAEAAVERGFDMVVKDQSLERVPESHDEAVMAFSQRIVIYARPEYDLTDEVVRRMNARHAAEEKKTEPFLPE